MPPQLGGSMVESLSGTSEALSSLPCSKISLGKCKLKPRCKLIRTGKINKVIKESDIEQSGVEAGAGRIAGSRGNGLILCGRHAWYFLQMFSTPHDPITALLHV